MGPPGTVPGAVISAYFAYSLNTKAMDQSVAVMRNTAPRAFFGTRTRSSHPVAA